MATPSIWSNVQVAMQSALGAGITISTINKSGTAQATYTGTVNPANGDYITLGVLGMTQLNGTVKRVINVIGTANTFQLEGVDSTNFDTFISGSAQVVTFGNTISNLTDLSASGGDPDQIDTTTIHDATKTQIPGAFSAAVYSFGSLWDPADAGQAAMKSASDLKAQRAFRFTFANASKVVFVGYVAASGLPVGSAQDKVTTPVQITMFGRPTNYSS